MSFFCFFKSPRPSKGNDLVYFSFTKKLYHSTITASLLCLMFIRSCVYQVLGCAFFKVQSCVLRSPLRWPERHSCKETPSWRAQLHSWLERPRPGDITKTMLVKFGRSVNCAGCFPGAGGTKPHTDACRDRSVQATKADLAERDKYCRRKTLERCAGGGARQAQCRRGAHRGERREVPAAAACRVRLRWRWMSTLERGPPKFWRSIGRVWPRRCAR